MASGKARASYGSKMKVYTGIELGQPTQNKLAADDVLSLCDYDFVIGSLHNLKNEQDFYFLEYNNDNVNDLLERYFTQLYELAVDNRFDTLAHMTYPLRYIVGNVTKKIKYDTYKEMIDEVLKVLVRNKKSLRDKYIRLKTKNRNDASRRKYSFTLQRAWRKIYYNRFRCT